MSDLFKWIGIAFAVLIADGLFCLFLAFLTPDDDDKWFNWYKWHNDFWSTKWNACKTQILDDNSVKFDTAWNAPDPIFRELSRKYPGVVIDIFCDFEMGESYELKYLNGEQIDVQNVTLHFTEDTEEN